MGYTVDDRFALSVDIPSEFERTATAKLFWEIYERETHSASPGPCSEVDSGSSNSLHLLEMVKLLAKHQTRVQVVD